MGGQWPVAPVTYSQCAPKFIASDAGFRGARGGAWRLGARGLGGVYQQRGLVHISGQQGRPGLQAVGDAVVDECALVGGRFLEYPVRHLGLVAWVANADAQAPVVG